MPDRDVFAIYRARGIRRSKALRLNVKTDLMAEEIKINPFVRFAALRTSDNITICLLYTSPSPRDATLSHMPSSA